MTQKRVIILIGKTGNGKSTLANVLSGTNEFQEGDSMISETKKYKSKEFKHEGVEYTVIDTPGLSDTNPENQKDKYREIVKAVCSTEGSLNQVLFVTSGKFTKEESKAYDLLWGAFFNEGIHDFTIIVRTNFPRFKNKKACRDDIKSLENESKELVDIINNCDERVIHVDNPPINIDDEERIKLNKKDRENSRKVLLEHLAKCSNVYKHESSSLRASSELREMEKLGDDMTEIKNSLIKNDIRTQELIKAGKKAVSWGEQGMKAGAVLGIGGLFNTVSLSKPFTGSVSAAVGTAVGAVSAATNVFGQATHVVAKRTGTHLENKYKKSLGKSIEKWESLKKCSNKVIEDADKQESVTVTKEKVTEAHKSFAELIKSSRECINEVEEALKELRVKLEIKRMFEEKQNQKQQIQIPPK